uniref:Uncharacterized protein n=1 Tax=Anguilla anguilla TaxID=7936 RepID=A0A0E9S557_ANGAN
MQINSCVCATWSICKGDSNYNVERPPRCMGFSLGIP